LQADYDNFMENHLDFGDIFSNSEADLVKLNQELANC